jgi:hypothetical protein
MEILGDRMGDRNIMVKHIGSIAFHLLAQAGFFCITFAEYTVLFWD